MASPVSSSVGLFLCYLFFQKSLNILTCLPRAPRKQKWQLPKPWMNMLTTRYTKRRSPVSMGKENSLPLDGNACGRLDCGVSGNLWRQSSIYTVYRMVQTSFCICDECFLSSFLKCELVWSPIKSKNQNVILQSWLLQMAAAHRALVLQGRLSVITMLTIPRCL